MLHLAIAGMSLVVVARGFCDGLEGGYCRSLMMVRCQPHLAAEDAIPDNGIEQHEGVDKDARTPEHERKAGVGGCAGVDRDGERNHVGPERKRERAEGRNEDERNHTEWPTVIVTQDAAREDQRRDATDG